MNLASHDRLNSAAQSGDIDGLYSVIGENPHVLEDIDSIPFVETPLHVAASAGHHQFAIELMRLKPSFALKLNTQGFTPIHLALQHNHNTMVLHLVDINKDLIRVKGREGLTPLHFVSQVGAIDLLIEFLQVCPDSTKDVTIKNESALHIAVRHGQYDALQLLVGWLMKTSEIDDEMERRILNHKDEEGNTILHVLSHQNNLQMVELLVKTKVDLKTKNYEGRLALDISDNEEIRNILVKAGANSSVTDMPALPSILKSKFTFIDRIVVSRRRSTRHITEDQRNAYLIIATLVMTATYQAALSPPGGAYQANVGHNDAINATNCLNSNISIPNSTTIPTLGNHAGTSVLPRILLFVVSYINCGSFVLSALIIIILFPAGRVGQTLSTVIFYFTGSYFFSSCVTSPVGATLFLYCLCSFFPALFLMGLYEFLVETSRGRYIYI